MNALRHAPMALKVALAPGVAILLMLVLGLMSWVSSRSLAADLANVGDTALERVTNAEGLLLQITELQLDINQSLAYEGMGQRPEAIAAIDERLKKNLGVVQQALEGFAGDTALEAPQRERAQAAVQQYKTFAKAIADMLDLKTVQLATAGSFAAPLADSYRALRSSFEAIVQGEVKAAQALADAGLKRSQRLQQLAVLLLLGAVVAAVVVTLMMNRLITGALATAKAQAEQLEAGDLREQELDVPRDATGRVIAALQSTAGGLRGLVQQVRDSAEQINLAAGEIASGNQDLSGRTEATASALEQTAASIEELTQTTRNSADNAREANRLAQQAAVVAREGGTEVGEVVRTMDEINAQARKIAEIIGTIDGIAFQTNILALNAAVEAARAGEQGRGFAVVAGEVRLLAQRSAEAAKEIRSLIQSSVERIDGGVGKVQKAGQTMERIVDAIARVTQMVDDVTRAAGEQANGIAQVHEAVSDMDRNTQQNAAMVEQAAAAAATLRQQAESLVAALTRFRL